MIQKFEVKDFKCHEGWNEFVFPGLTLVSGTNNSGKSSLLQSVYVLTQNKTSGIPVLILNEQLKLGSFSDILNKEKRNDETIEYTITFDRKMIAKDKFQSLRVNFIYKNPATLQEIEYKDCNPVLEGMKIYYQMQDGGGAKSVELKLVDKKKSVFYKLSGDIENGYCRVEGLTPESIIYLDMEQKQRKLAPKEFELVRDYIKAINVDNFKYLKAYRVDDYRESGNVGINGIGIEGEYTAEIISTKWNTFVDYADGDGQKHKFSELFDFWIKKILGLQYVVRSEREDKNKYKIIVKEPKYNLELGINQVGFGITQLLPILAMVLTSNERDIILIENPEIHLHPKLQADLVDLFIFALNNGRKLIIETHSEHIINRIRLRIKEDNELLSKINIYFFEKEEEVVRYQEIEVDKYGKISYWPKNFFDQGYYDLLGLIQK